MKMVRGMGPGAQWRADGAAHRHYRGRGNADWSSGCRDCGAWAGRSRVREAGSRMGKCSLMFAYVRLCSLYWRKMFEASDGEGSSILQNARPTEMGTRGARPSKYQRQRLARTK